jgi:hypothetical protein
MDSLFEGEIMTRNIFATVGLCSLLAIGFFPATVHAHPEESRVSIEKDEDITVQAGAVSVGFQLIDFKQHQTLNEPDLAILHEKKLHCFFFDPALREFHHQHAEFVNNEWRVSVSLPVIANQMGMLMLQVVHADGSQPSLAPYLGEIAHIVAVSDDGDSLMHVHPEGQPGQTEMRLHTMFTRAGEYRLWVELVDGGFLKTIPLSVVVQPASPKNKNVKINADFGVKTNDYGIPTPGFAGITMAADVKIQVQVAAPIVVTKQ